MKKAAFWDRVWGHFGANLGVKIIKRHWILWVLLQKVFLNRVRFGATFLMDLGSILARKSSSNGTQNDSKTVSNIDSKMIGFLIGFWSSLEAMTIIECSARV